VSPKRRRLAILARKRRVGDRQDEERERRGAHQGATALHQDQQHRKDARDRNHRPHDVFGYEWVEGNTEAH
jgi:hypothetical protein